MRIIGGILRGKKLKSFKGRDIRPTSDRTKEAIFNILTDRVSNGSVLDLYAGSGALGLEALSRGADHVTFIDISSEAISLLNNNLRSCRFESRARTIVWDIVRNLKCLNKQPQKFDIVFMDPPYQKELAKPTLTNLHSSAALKPGAILVFEHSLSDRLPKPLTHFNIIDQRRYGKTLVSFLRYML